MTLPRTLGLTLFAAGMACSQLAAAASIRFDPAAIDDLAIGDRLTLDIVGSDFTAGSAGGGVNLKWDAAVLSIAAAADIELLFPGDQFFFSKGTLDNAGGTLTNLSTNSFNGIVDSSFTIARIAFTALAAGSSLIALDLGSFGGGGSNVWTTAAGAEITDLSFEAASVTVAPVPLPAALGLMPGALAVLALRLRSRKPEARV
ncbi:MAG TPA: hypothetical protein PJ986_11505 [Gammaproteobacteria bacterium]|nr:hypothetical protein [Gammaproteobacteria bacterium]